MILMLLDKELLGNILTVMIEKGLGVGSWMMKVSSMICHGWCRL
jgi:hypothetical protein